MLPGFCIPMAAGADTPVAPTWNPANMTANAVLTVSNTVLNHDATPTAQAAALGVTSWNTGLHYFECKLVGTKAINDGVGFCNANFSSGAPTAGGHYWQIGIIGATYGIFKDGSHVGLNPFGTPAANDIINCAWNATTGEIFLGLNGTYYDNLGGAVGSTPTTPSFDTSDADITAGMTLFPIGNVNSTTANYTLIPPTILPTSYVQWG